MDEILQKTHNLQVTGEDEEWEEDKSLSITIAKSNLRGRLCTNSDHSRGFLKKVLGGIWRLKDGEWNLKIKEKFETCLFLTFTFASESIHSRILSKMPWYLSNGVLILGKMENSNESWKHDLTSFPIWGRAWDVPIDLLTINNTVRMAAKAGEVDGKEDTAAYGKWLRVGNEARGRTNGEEHDMEKQKIADDSLQQSTISAGRIPTASPFPSLHILEKESSGSLPRTETKDNKESQEQQLLQENSISPSKNHELKAKYMDYVEIQTRNDEGNRGKHRIVEDYGDVGYGKMKKLTTTVPKVTQDQELYNVPVFYDQEAKIMEEAIPFAVGSCSKNVAKENRRKVAVKKDSKARKGKYEETLTHALWSCEKVRTTWKLCSWYKNCSRLEAGSMFDVLVAIKQMNTRNDFEDTIKVMWAIWENRNRKWQQLPYMNDATTNMKKWIPPANSCICVNCDAAVVDKTAAKMAETWAILEALKHPPAEAISQIEVQSDCKVLVEEINNLEQYHSAESNLLHQIRKELSIGQKHSIFFSFFPGLVSQVL
ncbi:hypothetical protein F8388_023117 [Cannabis sativa]|uniref:RNase H type-1 domain-containing protein n=1 Tax=Cannabis sativa TaxID=3483 RepID=A0A7J6FM95_CANSA|nr:hypothetical protein F8388_023117 [Cannabis sativa]